MRMEQMTADTVLLKLQNVTKTRNDWKVLNHVTAEVRENRIIGVIGNNGIGTVSYTHLTLPTICSV